MVTNYNLTKKERLVLILLMSGCPSKVVSGIHQVRKGQVNAPFLAELANTLAKESPYTDMAGND